MSDFADVWQRIVLLQGQTFYQKTGKPFTYTVSGNSVRLQTTNRQLSRSQFSRAFDRVPLHGPGQLQDLQGPSYLFAILTDTRVTGDGRLATGSRPVTTPDGDCGPDEGPRGRSIPDPATDAGARMNTPRGMPESPRSPELDDLHQLDPHRVLLITACSAAKAVGGEAVGGKVDQRWPEDLHAARARVLTAAQTGPSGGLLPAWRRYTGTFYRYASPVLREAVASGNVVIISGGFGVVRADEPITWYDKVLRLADWPAGLVESMLINEARRTGVDTVVAFVSAKTSYAQLVRRTQWQAAGINAYLVTITGVTGGAMFEVPRQLGLAFCAFWNQQWDGFPPGVVVERLLCDGQHSAAAPGPLGRQDRPLLLVRHP